MRDWNSYYESSEEPWTKPDATLVAEAEGLSPGKALDLGCAEGAESLWLAAQGWQVTGVDYAPAAIATLERLAGERGLEVRGVVADMFAYEPDDNYDLIYLGYIHVRPEERGKMLGMAAGALLPGGTLLYNAISRSGAGPEPEFPKPLLSIPEEVIADLDGLDIEKADVATRTIECSGGSFEGNGMVVRARRSPKVEARPPGCYRSTRGRCFERGERLESTCASL